MTTDSNTPCVSEWFVALIVIEVFFLGLLVGWRFL